MITRDYLDILLPASSEYLMEIIQTSTTTSTAFSMAIAGRKSLEQPSSVAKLDMTCGERERDQRNCCRAWEGRGGGPDRFRGGDDYLFVSVGGCEYGRQDRNLM